jgi:hypothetical protein
MRNAKGSAATNPPEWWPKKLVDETVAADLLGLTVPTLRDWRCRRTVDLPFVKLGAAVRYSPDDMWVWLNRNTVRPAVCA